jgi:hypothetical protein
MTRDFANHAAGTQIAGISGMQGPICPRIGQFGILGADIQADGRRCSDMGRQILPPAT